MKSTLIVLFSVAMLFSGACKKSSSEPARDSGELLTSVRWQMISIITRADASAPETDIYSTIPEFQKDDYFLFSTDSTYELNDNELLRNDTSIRIIDAGRWSLERRGDQEYLDMISNTFSAEYLPGRITLLNADHLELERIYPSDQSMIRTRYRALK